MLPQPKEPPHRAELWMLLLCSGNCGLWECAPPWAAACPAPSCQQVVHAHYRRVLRFAGRMMTISWIATTFKRLWELRQANATAVYALT